MDFSKIASLLGNKGAAMPSNEVLFEIKAGRMNYDGKRVTADKRRGCIKVVKDAQGIKQFQWVEAGSNNPTQNVMIFPGEAKFEKVKQSKDRVYLLEFTQSKQRHFYWFQEKDESEDADKCQKLHNVINGLDANAKPQAKPDVKPRSAGGPQTRAPPTSQPPNPGTQDYNDLVSQFLSQANLGKMAEQVQRHSGPGLNSVIKDEAKNKILEDEKACERLFEHCPQPQQDLAGLRESLHSPQIRHALSGLQQAIESGKGYIILRQMGIDPNNPSEYAEIVELFNNIAKGA
uniref:Pru domain-containing protein n=1 Tax=Euplotes harpa TaxID=151035 RepID=A0A7S3N8P2_9SPIT|mmetsp:Transcript_24045/g.27733  ORF Transcript_24045/g.27733 Transcript_24045/m.27733 type:complete len:289 (+) Transcript_24045:26-892(+)